MGDNEKELRGGSGATACVGRGRARVIPRALCAPSPRGPKWGRAGFPTTEVLKSQPRCNYSGEKATQKMVKSNKGAGRKSRETKVFLSLQGERNRRRWPNSVPSRHLVAMLCHCSSGCGGRSGCGMLPGDGSLPVPRDVCGGAKAHLSQNHGLKSRPFFVEGLVCLDSKYCAVKEQMCVLLIGGLREVRIGNSPAPSNIFKRIHMCSAHLNLPQEKPAL